jgi:hypothetical protein
LISRRAGAFRRAGNAGRRKQNGCDAGSDLLHDGWRRVSGARAIYVAAAWTARVA